MILGFVKELKEDKDFAAAMIGVSLVVLLMVGVIFALVRTTSVQAVVKKRSWQIVQHVEELKRGIYEEGWYCPTDAYAVTTDTRIHHYDRVYSHTTWTRVGNTRTATQHYTSHPVCQTYYCYKVDRWREVDPRVSSGDNTLPMMPPVTLTKKFQRMAGKDETYTLYFEEVTNENKAAKETWTSSVSYEEWLRWDKGTRVELLVNSIGVREIKAVASKAQQ